MSILCVEDEQRVRAFMVRGLTEEGYVVQEAGNTADALPIIERGGVDLVLLDWMLPGASGLALLHDLRARGRAVPVVMLTARDAVEDRVAALNAGADDYLVKPFVFDELVARVRAVLRRASPSNTTLGYADLTLDRLRRTVTRAGREVSLTTREFELLQFLLAHAEQPVSRTQIVEAVWDHDFDTFSNVVEVYIRYLRTKVDDPFPTKLIHTVRGVGYVLKRSA